MSLLLRILSRAREGVFHFVEQMVESIQQSQRSSDREFLENSIDLLDERLKKHYPMKGKTEVEVMQVRSSQITQHKLRYERYAKTTLENVDHQTAQFNFHVEGALTDMRSYENQQKAMRDGVGVANTLAKFQGIHNTIKENYFKFGESIQIIYA